ncbi:OLC1v1010973C1 [Oldenlandia corymbosa var. corymbosa]|uniref:OLC1v1010973C1 n=1 Tax=Oldenlandia corymbosa var. corymbosa TaxID=529605 RepID=A0AAV1DUZ9_OLDCO|nr:OLC1v1010973C1 [Oldenlandia corymbosa var. corymbosa]
MEGDCDTQAAWTLLQLRNTAIDAETARQLRVQRRKIEEERRNRNLTRQRRVFDGGLIGRQTKDEDHHRRYNNNNVGLLARKETADRRLPGNNDDHQLPRYPPRTSVARSLIQQGCCSEPFDKVLMTSDLSSHLQKLALKRGKVTKLWLPMLEPGEDVVAGIKVRTYDWLGNRFDMTFKAWTDKRNYVLTSGWLRLCETHKDTMAVGDRVVIWMFRDTSNRICFALSLIKNNNLGRGECRKSLPESESRRAECRSNNISPNY